MDNYRIAIKELSNGTKQYLPQKRGCYGWNSISLHITEWDCWDNWLDTEQKALGCIERDKITCKISYKTI